MWVFVLKNNVNFEVFRLSLHHFINHKHLISAPNCPILKVLFRFLFDQGQGLPKKNEFFFFKTDYK